MHSINGTMGEVNFSMSFSKNHEKNEKIEMCCLFEVPLKATESVEICGDIQPRKAERMSVTDSALVHELKRDTYWVLLF